MPGTALCYHSGPRTGHSCGAPYRSRRRGRRYGRRASPGAHAEPQCGTPGEDDHCTQDELDPAGTQIVRAARLEANRRTVDDADVARLHRLVVTLRRTVV